MTRMLALTFATRPADGQAPRGAIRLFGRGLLEMVARQAAEVGAEQLIVHGEGAADLMAALPEAGGWPLKPQAAVDPASLAALIKPTDRVLLFDEGLLIDRRLVALMADAPETAAIAVWPVSQAPAAAVRLDASYVSAGLSVVAGHFLLGVLAGLGDWDLQQTLPRAAIDADIAVFVDVTDLGEAGATGAAPTRWLWRLLSDSREAAAAEQALQAMAPPPAPQWPQYWLDLLIDRLLPGGDRRIPSAPRLIAPLLLTAGLLPLLPLAFDLPATAALLALVWPSLLRVGQLLRARSNERPWRAELVGPLEQAPPLIWLAGYGVWLAQGSLAGAGAASLALALALIRRRLPRTPGAHPGARAAAIALWVERLGLGATSGALLLLGCLALGPPAAGAWALALYALATLAARIEAMRGLSLKN